MSSLSQPTVRALSEIERATWLDWRRPAVRALPSHQRVYIGHETCERLLPSAQDGLNLLRELGANDSRPVSLVTPFLTEVGLSRARRLIDDLLKCCENLEIVCNDWGLLWELATTNVGQPVLGRLLAGQTVDPRTATNQQEQTFSERMVRHVDGTLCVLRFRPPTPEKIAHLRSVAVDQTEVAEFFASRGVTRCELSSTSMGLQLQRTGWHYTLYRPFIPLAVERCQSPPLRACPCVHGEEQVWRAPDFPIPLIRRDNVVGYRQLDDQSDDALVKLGIDRVVETESMAI